MMTHVFTAEKHSRASSDSVAALPVSIVHKHLDMYVHDGIYARLTGSAYWLRPVDAGLCLGLQSICSGPVQQPPSPEPLRQPDRGACVASGLPSCCVTWLLR